LKINKGLYDSEIQVKDREITELEEKLKSKNDIVEQFENENTKLKRKREKRKEKKKRKKEKAFKEFDQK